MGAERRRIASLLTTATMVLNTNMAVSDVQVVVGGDSPGKTPGVGNFSGEIYGEIEGWFRCELRNWDLKVENSMKSSN